MLRRTLLVPLISLLFALPAAAQSVDGVAGLTELPPPSGRICPRGDAAEASCHVAHPVQGDAPRTRNEPKPVSPAPEPADWMVWLCGIAIAAVIALRRLRSGGLAE